MGLVMREYCRRAGAPVEVGDLRGRRSRLDVRQHRDRLVQLSELLDGLVHVSPAETALLAERIARLEDDLQSLITSASVAAE
jgi:hypothetical protein